MATFNNIFGETDKVFKTKFENVTFVSGTDYESGYKDGYAYGQNAAKEKLTVLSATQNGTYLPQNGAIGFSKVDVSVKSSSDENGSYEDGYRDGYQAGLSEGYANGFEDGKLAGKAEGYDEGYSIGRVVGDSEGFLRGQTEGYNEALSKRTELVIDANGTYTPQDGSTGFSKVIANVEGGVCTCLDVTLYEDGIIELKNAERVIEEADLYSWETGYDLYEVDEYGYLYNIVSQASADMAFSWDVSSAMKEGRRYVAIGKIYDVGSVVFSARSNMVSMPITVTLSENGLVTAGDGGEFELLLFSAENSSLIQNVGYVDIPYNVSSLMEEGKSYFVILLVRNGEQYKSNTVVFSNKSWFLTNYDDGALWLGLIVEGDYLYVGSEPWTVHDYSNGESVGYLDPEGPFYLGNLDKSKSYYVYNGVGDYRGADLQYGTPPEPVWLFKDEWLYDSPRDDLPSPQEG